MILLSSSQVAVIPPAEAVIAIAFAPVPSALFRDTVDAAPVLALILLITKSDTFKGL